MREVKYRAISQESNEFVYGWLQDVYIHTGFSSEYEWWGVEIIEGTEGQYTGLKDKNGKEIYEGDVIKGGSRIMEIVFNQQACQWWLVWEDKDGINRYEPLTANYGDDRDYFSNDNLEVIGNIHENNELINNI